MTQQDTICPSYVGEDRIKLALAPHVVAPIRALSSVDITVDYARAKPVGVMLPLVMTITAPSPSGFVRVVFRYMRPTAISFRPKEAGTHLVRLYEPAHNKWFGALTVDVVGDNLRSF